MNIVKHSIKNNQYYDSLKTKKLRLIPEAFIHIGNTAILIAIRIYK